MSQRISGAPWLDCWLFELPVTQVRNQNPSLEVVGEPTLAHAMYHTSESKRMASLGSAGFILSLAECTPSNSETNAQTVQVPFATGFQQGSDYILKTQTPRTLVGHFSPPTHLGTQSHRGFGRPACALACMVASRRRLTNDNGLAHPLGK